MTVANTNNRTRLAVSGATYDFTFKINSSSELLVYLIDADGVATLKTLTTDYTVSISSVTEGGTVTFVSGTPSAAEVLMIRNKSYVQSADIPVRGGFNETVIEGALDSLVMQIQQLKELLDFAVLQSSTAVPVTVRIPEPQDGYALGWDGTAGAMQNIPVDADAVTDAVADAQAAQAAAEAAQAAAELAETHAETAETNAETAEANTSALLAAATNQLVKGWFSLNMATATLLDSYNVSGVVDNGTGDFTINWGTDFANANYAVVLTAKGNVAEVVELTAIGAPNITILARSAGVATDLNPVMGIAIGDQ